MRQITTIMGELLKILPRYEFEKLEKQHRSNHYTKYYTGWQQLVTLLFAQIAGHDSLRAIQTSIVDSRASAADYNPFPAVTELVEVLEGNIGN